MIRSEIEIMSKFELECMISKSFLTSLFDKYLRHATLEILCLHSIDSLVLGSELFSQKPFVSEARKVFFSFKNIIFDIYHSISHGRNKFYLFILGLDNL